MRQTTQEALSVAVERSAMATGGVLDATTGPLERWAHLDGRGRVGLFAVYGDDSEWVWQPEHVTFGERVCCDDCVCASGGPIRKLVSARSR